MVFSANSEYLFVAGIDNCIKAINLTSNSLDFSMYGHTDTITSLSLSHSGNFLLSNSMDNTLRCWDVRPFIQGEQRQMKIYYGHQHTNLEKNLLGCGWSHDDRFVTAASADRLTYVWNWQTQEIENRLGGHKGCVNDVKFSPN